MHPASGLAQRQFKELKGAWTWEVNEFVQTGIVITQPADGSILQSFQRAGQVVTMIEGWWKPKDKWVDDEQPMVGKVACRSALGGLQFLASQGGNVHHLHLSERGNVRNGDSHQQVHSGGPRGLSEPR